MQVPADRRYTSEHEWAKVVDGEVLVGITDYAQSKLGDVVYVELPNVGDRVEAMKSFGSVESVKTASDLFAPIAGTVTAVNTRLRDQPELVNQSPYDEGWMIRIRPDDPNALNDLLTAEQYQQLVAER
ncbi:MAG TPA: glycine cleavage system protein GcvH [Chloroflexota bacterium]